jgi:uncharacterized protein YbjT (DUF2867 family)
MKVAVIGATGQVGAKVVKRLDDMGHQTAAAALRLGTDVLTGEGLADVLAGADVLVDVTNAPSFEAKDVMNFFTTSAGNLVAAAKESGIGHYVVLSVVGVGGLEGSGYMCGKIAQERIIRKSGLPFTIVRATQFHEFTATITSLLTTGAQTRVPDAMIQPIAIDEAVAEVARVAVSEPVLGIVSVGGPDRMSFADMASLVIASRGENSEVVVDADATYFGAALESSSLVTQPGAVIGRTRLLDWLSIRASQSIDK